VPRRKGPRQYAPVTRNRPYKGCLLKPIRVADAQARGLNAAFALPPDDADVRAYLDQQFQLRVVEFDRVHHVYSESKFVWFDRLKAVVERIFGIERNDPRWFIKFFLCLARRHVPGFSIKRIGEKRHEAPVKWTSQRKLELLADIEHINRQTNLSRSQICNRLPDKPGYKDRWGTSTGASLRKAYSQAT
jgi:hypothetical protein